MRKIYVCPDCKGVNWKISFALESSCHIMHCSKCGFHVDIMFDLAPFGLERINLDTIDMGLENTGALTDQDEGDLHDCGIL